MIVIAGSQSLPDFQTALHVSNGGQHEQLSYSPVAGFRLNMQRTIIAQEADICILAHAFFTLKQTDRNQPDLNSITFIVCSLFMVDKAHENQL